MGDRLKDKVTLVSGAGSRGPWWGNGKATAVLFAREGAKVLAADINLDAALETKRIIEAAGGICEAVAGDVSRTHDVAAMVDTCIAAFGQIDVLHNNVGIVELGADDPTLAIAVGRRLCEELLEPLQATFGRVAIRSAYRAPAVNTFGNAHGLSCASNERNYARHIWDRRDARGCMGALATVVVPWFADRYAEGADWRAMAWWIHDHLPYSELQFFPKLAAFNIGWHERPKRRIDSFITPRGCLTRPGMESHEGDHSQAYTFFPRYSREAPLVR